MDIIQTLILAIVQGITEWLPISSSGHLAIIQEYYKIESTLTFDIALHLGTILVVSITFREDVLNILKAFFKRDFGSKEGNLALFVIVGSIPTAIIGFLLMYFEVVKTFFSNMLAVGLALLLTGIFLYASRHAKDGRDLCYLDSLFLGIAQGVAAIPGISRSGLTISVGLLRRVERESVFKYSFILSIPAVLGAMVAAIVSDYESLTKSSSDLGFTILGAATSLIVGYMALQLLKKIFMKQRFCLFAYYCWLVAISVIFLYFV